MAVPAIPQGFHSITPYLMVSNASGLIDFLKSAFSAEERSCHRSPEGAILNAELTIGDSIIMVADARDDYKPMPTTLYLYVNDTDQTYQQALQAGAQSLLEPKDQFYGDRNAGVQDPSGNQWWIATHIEDVSEAELQKRMQAIYANKSQ